MVFPHSAVEQSIIVALAKGPLRVTTLVANIAKELNVTPEAAYLGLRNLRKKRVAVTTKGIASLYVFWMQEMQKFVNQLETNYGHQYTELLLFRDIVRPEFRSKTISCPTFDSLETTFHHLAQSIIKPVTKPTPYFFFGFAPWWMTLCPEDADAFVQNLVGYGYVPLMVFTNKFPIDKETVIRLKNLGCQIAFTEEKKLPFGFEGHYVDGYCLEALHPPKQYPAFFMAYSTAKASQKEEMESIMRAFKNGKVRLSKKKAPFSKAVLDLFAVSKGLFKN